jgi:hypothetical protein
MRMNAVLRFFFSMSVSAILLGISVTAGAQSSAEYLPGFAAPLTIDTGAAGFWQSLQKLHTRASIIAINAHPDDEDGGMLAYRRLSSSASLHAQQRQRYGAGSGPAAVAVGVVTPADRLPLEGAGVRVPAVAVSRSTAS